jgi:ATP-dependent RNA helicase RhlE
MQEIERFTKQKIEVQVIDGFGPEPGEHAEPIAMGRQTIWGGAGKPPSRDVMMAAAKAARSEMMQRIRDNKGASGGAPRGSAGNGQGRGGNAPRQGNGHPAPARHGQAPSRQPDPLRGGGNVAPRTGPAREPDPMRTSVDMMAERGGRRGGGGFGGNRRNGAGGGYGGGGRSGGGSGGAGGGGYGPRGPGASRGPVGR